MRPGAGLDQDLFFDLGMSSSTCQRRKRERKPVQPRPSVPTRKTAHQDRNRRPPAGTHLAEARQTVLTKPARSSGKQEYLPQPSCSFRAGCKDGLGHQSPKPLERPVAIKCFKSLGPRQHACLLHRAPHNGQRGGRLRMKCKTTRPEQSQSLRNPRPSPAGYAPCWRAQASGPIPRIPVIWSSSRSIRRSHKGCAITECDHVVAIVRDMDGGETAKPIGIVTPDIAAREGWLF